MQFFQNHPVTTFFADVKQYLFFATYVQFSTA